MPGTAESMPSRAFWLDLITLGFGRIRLKKPVTACPAAKWLTPEDAPIEVVPMNAPRSANFGATALWACHALGSL